MSVILEETENPKFKVILGYIQLVTSGIQEREKEKHNLAEEHWSSMCESLSLVHSATKGASENKLREDLT